MAITYFVTLKISDGTYHWYTNMILFSTQEPEPPKILNALADTDTSVGGSAMLELKMKGYPRPQMKWTKDGQAITAGDRFKFIYPDQESAALIINKVR